jgi:hypothetical protein
MPGIIQKLGSFPNSQIKPRSAVRDADVVRVPVTSAGEVQILSANPVRVKAIVKNEGPFPLQYDYNPGQAASEGFLVPVGGAINIEGGGDDVYAIGIGGDTVVSIDDRLG